MDNRQPSGSATPQTTRALRRRSKLYTDPRKPQRSRSTTLVNTTAVSLHYKVIVCIGRRINSIPRERLWFNLPLITYTDFYKVFKDFSRIKLNGGGGGAEQFCPKNLCYDQWISPDNLTAVERHISPQPNSETRKLWLWDVGESDTIPSKLADFVFLQRTHLKSITGHGNVKILPQGDLVFVYHITVKFFSNPEKGETANPEAKFDKNYLQQAAEAMLYCKHLNETVPGGVVSTRFRSSTLYSRLRPRSRN
jgi:hypothetical protein